MPYVYILLSEKYNTYYIGSTKDLIRRLKEHTSGASRFTKYRLPLRLIFSQKYPDIKTARSVENWIKKQKDRKLLIRIIKEGKINKEFV